MTIEQRLAEIPRPNKEFSRLSEEAAFRLGWEYAMRAVAQNAAKLAPRCECGFEFYCRMCGRELGE